jgi:hypothetical protein
MRREEGKGERQRQREREKREERREKREERREGEGRERSEICNTRSGKGNPQTPVSRSFSFSELS